MFLTRAKVITILVLSVLSFADLFSQGDNLTKDEYSKRMLQKYYEIKGLSLNKVNGFPNRGRNNLTMLLVDAKKNWSRLVPYAQEVFSIQGTRPTGLPLTYQETKKNYFRFYYTTTGANAVSTTDANSNGVPDYVEKMSDAFCKALDFYDSLGYNRPPVIASDNGRYCVYISNSEAGSYVYGYSQPETSVGDNPLTSTVETNSYTSYMVMRNNYIGFGSTAAELQIAMEVTAAHEFFHAVQFGYELDNMEGYLMEMCSTWAEDKVFPGDDDNWQYLPDIFDAPDVSLDWDEYLDGDPVNYSSAFSMHWYASWIFMRYLSDHYGSQVPKQVFEQNIKFSTSQAIDNVLKTFGSSYTAAIKDYDVALALLTQSQTAPMNQYFFERGNDYRTLTKNSGGSPAGPFVVKYEKTLIYNGGKVTYSSTSGNKRLMRASADFIKITATGNFSVTVTPKTATNYFYARLIRSDAYTNPTQLSVVEPIINASTYSFNVSDYNSFKDYVLVLYNANYSTPSSRDTNSIQYDITLDVPQLTNGVRITSPIGGESWQTGTLHNITWESANVSLVKIFYSTDSGSSWNLVKDSLAALPGSYVWTIPQTVSSSCKVRISDLADSSSYSESTANFSIVAPLPFSLISPNGGESWFVGSTHDIKWNPNNILKIKIEFSSNNGISWNTVVDSTIAATGLYSWIIPNNISSSCLIKVTDVSDTSKNSVSAGTFSIMQAPQQKIIITEDFSKVTSGAIGTPGSTDLSAALDTYTLISGWSGAKIYAAGGAVKIGSSSSQGYITTPTLDLSSNGGTGEISFDVQIYGADTKPMQVLLSTDNGTTFNQLGSDITPTTSMVNQVITFSGGAATSKVKFSAKTTSSDRFYLDNISVITKSITEVKEDLANSAKPSSFALAQNYPNPFNPNTTITFTLPVSASVELEIFNQLGEKISEVVHGEISEGTHSVVWNASGFPSGIYFYRMQANGFSFTRKLLLLK